MSRESLTSAMSQQPVPVLVFESGQQVSARSQQVLPSLQVWCWSPHSPAPSHLILDILSCLLTAHLCTFERFYSTSQLKRNFIQDLPLNLRLKAFKQIQLTMTRTEAKLPFHVQQSKTAKFMV